MVLKPSPPTRLCQGLPPAFFFLFVILLCPGLHSFIRAPHPGRFDRLCHQIHSLRSLAQNLARVGMEVTFPAHSAWDLLCGLCPGTQIGKMPVKLSSNQNQVILGDSGVWGGASFPGWLFFSHSSWTLPHPRTSSLGRIILRKLASYHAPHPSILSLTDLIYLPRTSFSPRFLLGHWSQAVGVHLLALTFNSMMRAQP